MNLTPKQMVLSKYPDAKCEKVAEGDGSVSYGISVFVMGHKFYLTTGNPNPKEAWRIVHTELLVRYCV